MAEERITIEEAARLSGVPYQTLKKRLQRNRAILFPDPEHKQRRLVRVSDLGPEAQRRHTEEKIKNAMVAMEPPKEAAAAIVPAQKAITRAPQSAFRFEPQIPTQEAINQAITAVPASRRKYVERWCEVIGMSVNGTWKKYKAELIGGRTVETKTDFERWLAEQNGVSHRDLQRKKAIYMRIKNDPAFKGNESGIFKAFIEELLPKPKSGRVSIFQRPGNEWMGITLRNLYLNQAQLSVGRAHQMLLEEIEAKQKAWKLGHLYEKPTLRQCHIALKNVSAPEEILNRLGDKAYNDKCSPYISRDPDSIQSNDVWVTDQKQMDVRLRGDGEQLGRIWMVSYLDARSFKVMGYWFGPILSSDMVISAAAMAIARHGVPKAILMDLGKEFQCTAFHGTFRKFRGDALFSETKGICQRLGIKTIDAIGRNPQTKPIERWHRECSRFDHNIPGWCGSNTSERPEVLIEFERQHQEWKSTGRGRSPLFTIQQYLYEFVNWVENVSNAKHRGRGEYLRGMTPDECWNTHLPPEGARRITASELDLATADHRVLKVARGGQINITIHGRKIEYIHPALFLRQGQELEVILRRGHLSEITVLDKAEDGRFLCEANAKPLFHWGIKTPQDREELRQAIRIRNAAKKAVRLGNAARRVLEVTAKPVEMGPQPPPIREISSTEFKMRKPKILKARRTETSNDLAREIFGGQE